MKKVKSASSIIARAMTEYKAKDYETALITLSEAPVDEDDYLDLAYLLGLCHVRLERYDEALLYLEQVVTSGGEDERTRQCRLTLAYIYSLTGRSKLAEYELRKLLASDGGSTVQVYSALAYVQWLQGKREEALSWYVKALEHDPENLNALNGYGYLLACAGKDLKKALTCCRKALDGDPGNPAYSDSLGWAYFQLGMLGEAAPYLHAASELRADHPDVIKHLKAFRKATQS
ncbi:MAG: tetratricopeptide repeat protein [Spirochaetota bacterium]